MATFAVRSVERERLDDGLEPSELRRSLEFMTGVNARFGGTSAILRYFETAMMPRAFTVLDLGTGAGDIPAAIGRWASQRGLKAEITAIDRDPACIDYARSHFASTRIRYQVLSALDIERLGHFDYIISSMLFHHLTDDEIVRVLALADKLSRFGFVMSDLERSPWNYAGASVLAALTGRRTIWNDARLSVARGFLESDFETYRERAHVPARVEKKWPFRIQLVR